MNLNPFDKNNLPSVSMFAKEKQESIRATTEAVADLEERFVVKEYLGVKMDYETRTFFNEIVGQIREERSMQILERKSNLIDDTGALTKLFCGDTQITTLPELPSRLTDLYCDNTQITSLPKLPSRLRLFSCNNTQITMLPELPTGLTELSCENTRITSLPELSAGLIAFNLTGTPLSKDQGFMDKLKKNHPYVKITH